MRKTDAWLLFLLATSPSSLLLAGEGGGPAISFTALPTSLELQLTLQPRPISYIPISYTQDASATNPYKHFQLVSARNKHTAQVTATYQKIL
jgi:hypothetical protein